MYFVMNQFKVSVFSLMPITMSATRRNKNREDCKMEKAASRSRSRSKSTRSRRQRSEPRRPRLAERVSDPARHPQTTRPRVEVDSRKKLQKPNLKMGGSKCLSCLTSSENIWLKERWTEASPETKTRERLAELYTEVMQIVAERELKSIFHWLDNNKVTAVELKKILGDFPSNESMHEKLDLQTWVRMQKYLLLEQLMSRDEFLSNKNHRDVEKRCREAEERAAKAEQVAAKAEKYAAECQKAAALTASSTAQLVESASKKPKFLVRDDERPKKKELSASDKIEELQGEEAVEASRSGSPKSMSPWRSRSHSTRAFRRLQDGSSSRNKADWTEPENPEKSDKSEKSDDSASESSSFKEVKTIEPKAESVTEFPKEELFRAVCGNEFHNQSGTKMQLGRYCNQCSCRWQSLNPIG